MSPSYTRGTRIGGVNYVMNNESKYKDFCVILNRPNDMNYTMLDFDVGAIVNYLSAFNVYVSGILHDCDLICEGTPKLNHIHLVITTPTRVRESTMLNRLGKQLGYPLNCITLAHCDSFCKSNRYLLHLDHPEKAQYYPFEVITNNQSRFDDCLTKLYDYIDFNVLYNVITSNGYNLLNIIESLGLETYQKYSRVIHDIINEVRQNGEKRQIKNY